MIGAQSDITYYSTHARSILNDTKVDPEKLMSYLANNKAASFSPSGILRIEVSDDGPINSAIGALEEIRASREGEGENVRG